MDVSWPRGLRWRAMIFHMARRTGFREQYYTGTRDISVSGKIAGNIKVKLYVISWWFFHEYLKIDQFVWAGFFCGTRIHQSASMDCDGVTQKIHMREIGRGQGPSTWWEFDRFHAQRPLDKHKWTPHGPGVCADAQRYSTWLEELASESNTIQAQEI